MKWLKAWLTSIGVVSAFAFILAIFLVGGVALHYDITFWASYKQHHAVHVSWVLCLLLGLIPVVSQVAVPAAIATWVISFFL